jgi:hypothetical protein
MAITPREELPYQHLVLIRFKLATNSTSTNAVLVKQRSPITTCLFSRIILRVIISHSQINSMAKAGLPTSMGTLFSYWRHHEIPRRRCPFTYTGVHRTKLPSITFGTYGHLSHMQMTYLGPPSLTSRRRCRRLVWKFSGVPSTLRPGLRGFFVHTYPYSSSPASPPQVHYMHLASIYLLFTFYL